MLVYVIISAVILNLSMAAFLRTGRIASTGTERIVDAHALQRFSESFTRTVRSADGFVDQVGPFASSGKLLLLKTANGHTGIGFAGEKLAIWDIEQVDGAFRTGVVRTFDTGYSQITFALDAEHRGEARRVAAQLVAAESADDETKSRTLVATLRVGRALP